MGPGQTWDESYPTLEAPESGAQTRSANRCRLTLVDPQTIHAQWEVRQDTFDHVRHELGEGWNGHRRILRVHGAPAVGDPDAPPSGFVDEDLDEGTTERSLTVDLPDRAYRVDMGVLTPAGLFYPVVSSNTVVTPNGGEQPAPRDGEPPEQSTGSDVPSLDDPEEPEWE